MVAVTILLSKLVYTLFYIMAAIQLVVTIQSVARRWTASCDNDTKTQQRHVCKCGNLALVCFSCVSNSSYPLAAANNLIY